MALDPVIGQVIAGVAASGINAVTQGGPRRQYKWNEKAANTANARNRENQQWLLQQNQDLQREQREYDSPSAQMQRYKDAGLNPHLIYGNGASAGEVFPINAGNIAPYSIQAPSASYSNVGSDFISSVQSLAQSRLADLRGDETIANTALKQIQADIAKTNPMLNPSVAMWVSNSMQESARLKTMEARTWVSTEDGIMRISKKVNTELDAMVQKLGLNTADLAIKNRILESKEFENAVKEVQARWLKDSEISPEHIRQGMMLLLSKMLGR